MRRGAAIASAVDHRRGGVIYIGEMADNDAQRRSKSYLLPIADADFLLRDEVRPLRFALEYAKSEYSLRDWGVRSTIIVFVPPGFAPAEGIATGAQIRAGQALLKILS